MKLIQIQTVPVGEIQANCYVLSLPERDDALVIDPGAEEPAIRLVLGKRRIAAILLTHGHYDHIGAVAALRAGLGAPRPMMILPAVWLSSLLSVGAGLGAAALFARGKRR